MLIIPKNIQVSEYQKYALLVWGYSNSTPKAEAGINIPQSAFLFIKQPKKP